MSFLRPWMLSICLTVCLPLSSWAQGQHGLALHGQVKYPPEFSHFDYTNPQAPKGGELRRAAIGSFDSFNPFIIKGAPAAGINYLFDTLTTQSADEPFSVYGLLAEQIELAADRSSITYTLREQARFHDGKPVTAEDVVFSFETLKTQGSPFYGLYYQNVTKAEALSARQVRFSFAAGDNRELALIIGDLPVLSKADWQGRAFAESGLTVPVGSGPYRMERFEAGRYVQYQRDSNYWGANLPVNRGLYNFDKIRFDYYRDTTVALEAFKADAYDWRLENVAKSWATAYDIPAVKQGWIKREEFKHQRVAGMQAYAFNLRRPLFQDRRVREALGLAFDFEWSNQNLFHGQYSRTRSYFDNSELAATGLPSAEELALLEPLREQLPAEVFTQEFQPAKNGPQLRDNLKRALELLQQAGWSFKGKQLVNAQGQPFSFEILLDDPSFERISLPYIKNLERLGINAQVRTVDSAQYQNRINEFDFDVTIGLWGQSNSPGNEQREFWGTTAADQHGSRNILGLKNPAVDQLVDLIISAPDRTTLVTRVRALDRVLQWGHYVVPHWYSALDRVAYWDRLAHPELTPQQGVQLDAWWYDTARAQALAQQRSSGQ